MASGARRADHEPQDDTGRPVLITTARRSYEAEHAARKRRYLLLMSVRIPALVLAAIAYGIWHNGWIALAIVAGSIPIPWIAVIGANDGPPRPKNAPRGYAGGSAIPFDRELPAALTGRSLPAAPSSAPGPPASGPQSGAGSREDGAARRNSEAAGPDEGGPDADLRRD